jgi:hypothetical protein
MYVACTNAKNACLPAHFISISKQHRRSRPVLYKGHAGFKYRPRDQLRISGVMRQLPSTLSWRSLITRRSNTNSNLLWYNLEVKCCHATNQFASSKICLLRSTLIPSFLRSKQTEFLSTNPYILRYGRVIVFFLHKNNFMEVRNFCCSKRPNDSVQRPPPKKQHSKFPL